MVIQVDGNSYFIVKPPELYTILITLSIFGSCLEAQGKLPIYNCI